MIAEQLRALLDALSSANVPLLFACAVFLPLVGVPASPLWVALGIRLGAVWGSAATVAAMVINVTLGYWLARGWARKWITSFLQRRGRTVPAIRAEDETHWVLLIRVTPGVPLFVQNYLLGLAGVRFGRYLLLSIPVQMLYAILFATLGHSLKGSTAWKALLLVLALVAAGIGVSLLRRHLQRRHAPPSSDL